MECSFNVRVTKNQHSLDTKKMGVLNIWDNIQNDEMECSHYQEETFFKS